ncbi:MAG: hypothetical protein ACFB9N_01980 [Geitlerinemataceae cyanobacterium]
MFHHLFSTLACSLLLSSTADLAQVTFAQFEPPPPTQPLDTDAGGSRAIGSRPGPLGLLL